MRAVEACMPGSGGGTRRVTGTHSEDQQRMHFMSAKEVVALDVAKILLMQELAMTENSLLDESVREVMLAEFSINLDAPEHDFPAQVKNFVTNYFDACLQNAYEPVGLSLNLNGPKSDLLKPSGLN